jgi:hypothetical protein
MTHTAVLLVFLLVAPFTTIASSGQAAVASVRKPSSKPHLAERIYGRHRKLQQDGSPPIPPLNSPRPPVPPPPWEDLAGGSSHPWWQSFHANFSALAAQSDLPGQVCGRYQGGCRTKMRHMPGSVFDNEGTLTTFTCATWFFGRDMI